MKTIKKCITLLLLMIPLTLFAKNNEIEKFNDKYILKHWINSYEYSITNKKAIENSFSIVQNGCMLELNNGEAILMKTKEKDFEFTFLHEISHCILGKEIFYHPIDWKVKIGKVEKDKIEKIISENEFFYIKNKKTLLIKVIYHEIFADTFASILYLRNNKEAEKDLIILLNNRKIQNKSPYDSHLSVSSIKYILENKEQIKNLTIEKLKDKAIKVTQEKLLEYIRAEYE